jgi:hypothetical protein
MDGICESKDILCFNLIITQRNENNLADFPLACSLMDEKSNSRNPGRYSYCLTIIIIIILIKLIKRGEIDGHVVYID